MKFDKVIFSKSRLLQIAAIGCLSSILCFTSDSFAETKVAQRVAVGTTRTAPRANVASRMPSVNIQESNIEQIIEDPVETTEENQITENNIIENKSSQFNSILENTVSSSGDKSADTRADMIRNQRAALDANDIQTIAKKAATNALTSGKNSCDTDLRTCMKQKCKNDFSGCSGDGDTIWGDKLNSCKRSSNCSGEEFQLFAAEIREDRDFNAKMSSYNETIDCGNKYNKCMISQCGNNFAKCIGKSTSDMAVSACASIASDCQKIDNGLTNRIQQVFGTLRNNAEVQVQKDEARLYELRDLMSNECKRFGALFDERSLDCVFTVNLFAGNSESPMASKKSYAGDSFDCNQDWFGIDVTTYKENAYRLTREQTSASSAMLGAGVGVAAGAISSGSIGRAMDSQKASGALDAAKSELGGDKTTTSVQEILPTEQTNGK
ncbi:MAG: hypothetical protein JW974_00090 [Alphaproteobacteria bacterium]|nr:hypothetical protein [Alphaproteobacteria bacterium]MBN2675085.1 hypothetical protein [Alphaproteobacteria bacterium]